MMWINRPTPVDRLNEMPAGKRTFNHSPGLFQSAVRFGSNCGSLHRDRIGITIPNAIMLDSRRRS
jgi:hypothetical protein